MTANVNRPWHATIGSARTLALTRPAARMLSAPLDSTQPTVLVWRATGGIHMIGAGSTSVWLTLTATTLCGARATSALIHVSALSLQSALLRDIAASASAYQITQEIRMALHVDQVSLSVMFSF